METKFNHVDFGPLILKLGFSNFFIVDCDMSFGGRRGGLCLLWNESLEITIKSSSLHHIDSIVGHGQGISEWRITGVYGWPDEQDKENTWQLLRDLNLNNALPWTCLGDFNEIVSASEKEGGIPRAPIKMATFRSALDECELVDLGFSGHQFTWTNQQGGISNIQERLDRAVANSQWLQIFPNVLVEHLVRFQSDHCPLLINWSTSRLPTKRRRKKKFRFEAMWLEDDSCKNIVIEAWNSAQGDQSPWRFTKKIGEMKDVLQQWEKNHFGNITRQINDLHQLLENIQIETPSNSNLQQVKLIEAELNNLMKKEEIMWRQRSRATWLKDGDKNTSFFHRTANGRRQRNKISRIRTGHNNWVEDEGAIERTFTDYFKYIFAAESTDCVDDVLESITPKITGEMNADLNKDYSADEVVTALNQMHPLKAPGPDGLPVIFYTKFWEVVREETVNLVLNILNNGASPKPLNHTHIVLIPKKKLPESPHDFRPISLCNVIVKITTKCIANRLKTFLPDIISHAQSAFVPGRLITDNALIAFETFHTMKTNKSKRLSTFALKLDMSKAYDRVEWSFLQSVMMRMGFGAPFVDNIMRNISSVTYSVLINGQPSNPFTPSRGLRQGDPLSPYLFLLCAEAFSSMIHKAETQGLLHGAKLCQSAPAISHLLFADDSLIFGKANSGEINLVREIIDKYSRASGQRVNLEKSELAFSKCISSDLATELGAQCSIPIVDHHNMYLGLPATIGRSKKDVFSSIEERVSKKLKNWKVRSLSQAGKLTLIKAVAQTIPLYVMSCFLIPASLIHRLEQMIANFWWGQKTDERKIHWASWDATCRSKDSGGLGLRDLECFNKAFLAKQGWRIITQPDSLLSRCLKARYFPRCCLLEAKVGYTPSFAWRSIMTGCKILHKGTRWTIRDGCSVKIWGNEWIPNTPSIYRPSPISSVLQELEYVRDLINDEGTGWNNNLIFTSFPMDIARKITTIPICLNAQPDCIRWCHTKDGSYSVKTGYWLAKRLKDVASSIPSSSSNSTKDWDWFWQLKIPPKIKIFIWRCMRGILPTKSKLLRRGIQVDPICSKCGSDVETIEHALRDCSWSSFFWKACPLRLSPPQPQHGVVQLQEWILGVIKDKPTEVIEVFASLLWTIWKARNLFIFQDKNLTHLDCFQMAHSVLFDYRDANKLKEDNRDNIPHQPDRSSPPPGCFKLNTDASIGMDGVTGLGGVIHDWQDVPLKFIVEMLPICQDIELAEAFACLKGINSARDDGLKSLWVEMDCQTLVSYLRRKTIPRTSSGTIIAEILRVVAQFDYISFNWIGRDHNKIAHQLASLARRREFCVDNVNQLYAYYLRHDAFPVP